MMVLILLGFSMGSESTSVTFSDRKTFVGPPRMFSRHSFAIITCYDYHRYGPVGTYSTCQQVCRLLSLAAALFKQN